MKKQDLKSGMVVYYRNGEKRTVLKNTPFGDLIVGDTFGYNPFSNYNEDLTNTTIPELDICQVWAPECETNLATKKGYKLIWSREILSRT